jgi:hypothetical protein
MGARAELLECDRGMFHRPIQFIEPRHQIIANGPHTADATSSGPRLGIVK